MTEQPEPWARVIAHNVLLAEHVHGFHPAALVIERAVEQRVAEALAERDAVIDVIEAMREPTPAMVAKIAEMANMQGDVSCARLLADWQAMIDAAAGEG